MEFRGMETTVVEVLRSPELQRLRRIRQLGLAHLVFPGAEHSRLVHSLGAAHLAIRFSHHLSESAQEFLAPFLQPDESVIRDLALAALFHDLGHGPLSHVWEREIVGPAFDRRAWCASLGLQYESEFERLKWHELVGQAILASETGTLHQLLEQQEAGTTERVRMLLMGDYYLQYFPRLLASDVDVDRCDFVLRDAMQAGVAYGNYDLAWLIATTTIGTVDGSRLVMGFDKRKAPRVIEQFLIARRALYDTVYQHKTVRAAEGMIGLLLRRLKEYVKKEGWPLSNSRQFQPFRSVIEGKPISVSDALGLDDYLLWVLIQELAEISARDSTLSDLATRIIARDLFKSVPCDYQVLDRFLRVPENHDRLKEAVSPYSAGMSSYYYFTDDVTFEMLATSANERAYFVDLDSSDRLASPITDHREIKTLQEEKRTYCRLYCVREAVEAISDLISGAS
jgi:hypothetical protein